MSSSAGAKIGGRAGDAGADGDVGGMSGETMPAWVLETVDAVEKGVAAAVRTGRAAVIH